MVLTAIFFWFIDIDENLKIGFLIKFIIIYILFYLFLVSFNKYFRPLYLIRGTLKIITHNEPKKYLFPTHNFNSSKNDNISLWNYSLASSKPGRIDTNNPVKQGTRLMPS